MWLTVSLPPVGVGYRSNMNTRDYDAEPDNTKRALGPAICSGLQMFSGTTARRPSAAPGVTPVRGCSCPLCRLTPTLAVADFRANPRCDPPWEHELRLKFARA